MGFHRTVMRNAVRQVARHNRVGVTAVWDDVMAMPWRARGCLAVVWTCKHKRRPKEHPFYAQQAMAGENSPRMAREGALSRLRSFIRKVTDAANSAAFMRARTARKQGS